MAESEAIANHSPDVWMRVLRRVREGARAAGDEGSMLSDTAASGSQDRQQQRSPPSPRLLCTSTRLGEGIVIASEDDDSDISGFVDEDEDPVTHGAQQLVHEQRSLNRMQSWRETLGDSADAALRRYYEVIKRQYEQAVSGADVILTAHDLQRLHEIPLVQQGNTDFYSEDNLKRRFAARTSETLLRAIDSVWDQLPKVDAPRGAGSPRRASAFADQQQQQQQQQQVLNYDVYRAFNAHVFHRLVPAATMSEFEALVAGDFASACERPGATTPDEVAQLFMTHAQFRLAMIDLVDVWTNGVDTEHYVLFSKEILWRQARKCRHLDPRAAFDLRAVFASKRGAPRGAARTPAGDRRRSSVAAGGGATPKNRSRSNSLSTRSAAALPPHPEVAARSGNPTPPPRSPLSAPVESGRQQSAPTGTKQPRSRKNSRRAVMVMSDAAATSISPRARRLPRHGRGSGGASSDLPAPAAAGLACPGAEEGPGGDDPFFDAQGFSESLFEAAQMPIVVDFVDVLTGAVLQRGRSIRHTDVREGTQPGQAADHEAECDRARAAAQDEDEDEDENLHVIVVRDLEIHGRRDASGTDEPLWDAAQRCASRCFGAREGELDDVPLVVTPETFAGVAAQRGSSELVFVPAQVGDAVQAAVLTEELGEGRKGSTSGNWDAPSRGHAGSATRHFDMSTEAPPALSRPDTAPPETMNDEALLCAVLNDTPPDPDLEGGRAVPTSAGTDDVNAAVGAAFATAKAEVLRERAPEQPPAGVPTYVSASKLRNALLQHDPNRFPTALEQLQALSRASSGPQSLLLEVDAGDSEADASDMSGRTRTEATYALRSEVTVAAGTSTSLARTPNHDVSQKRQHSLGVGVAGGDDQPVVLVIPPPSVAVAHKAAIGRKLTRIPAPPHTPRGVGPDGEPQRPRVDVVRFPCVARESAHIAAVKCKLKNCTELIAFDGRNKQTAVGDHLDYHSMHAIDLAMPRVLPRSARGKIVCIDDAKRRQLVQQLAEDPFHSNDDRGADAAAAFMSTFEQYDRPALLHRVRGAGVAAQQPRQRTSSPAAAPIYGRRRSLGFLEGIICSNSSNVRSIESLARAAVGGVVDAATLQQSCKTCYPPASATVPAPATSAVVTYSSPAQSLATRLPQSVAPAPLFTAMRHVRHEEKRLRLTHPPPTPPDDQTATVAVAPSVATMFPTVAGSTDPTAATPLAIDRVHVDAPRSPPPEVILADEFIPPTFRAQLQPQTARGPRPHSPRARRRMQAPLSTSAASQLVRQPRKAAMPRAGQAEVHPPATARTAAAASDFVAETEPGWRFVRGEPKLGLLLGPVHNAKTVFERVAEDPRATAAEAEEARKRYEALQAQLAQEAGSGTSAGRAWLPQIRESRRVKGFALSISRRPVQ